MLVECGLVRAHDDSGRTWTFRPSFARIAELGDPYEIVRTYGRLHGPDAGAEARCVLAALCDEEEASDLIGWQGEDGDQPGLMPEAEQILVARHLMRHGIVGRARPGRGDGKFTDRFEAAQFIAAARVHLGLSNDEAEALSMTEFQLLLDMKFPDRAQRERNVPTKEQYDAFMAKIGVKRA